MGKTYSKDDDVYVESKAVKDAKVVAENAPDETTKKEAEGLLQNTGNVELKENPKPAEKSYDISSLKKNPFEGASATAGKDEFDKLSEDDKKKFVIKAKVAENQTLDKKDMHEISRDDMIFAGLMNPPA
jgi:hypothetical protein